MSEQPPTSPAAKSKGGAAVQAAKEERAAEEAPAPAAKSGGGAAVQAAKEERAAEPEPADDAPPKDGEKLAEFPQKKDEAQWQDEVLTAIAAYDGYFAVGPSCPVKAVKVFKDGKQLYELPLTNCANAILMGDKLKSEDGHPLLLAGDDSGEFHVFDLSDGKSLKQVKVGWSVDAMGLSPCATKVAISCSGQMAALLDLKTGNLIWKDLKMGDNCNGIEFTPDGKEIITADRSGYVYFYPVSDEIPTHPPAKKLAARDQRFNALGGVSFSPDGKKFAVGRTGRTIYVFATDAADGAEPLAKLEQPLTGMPISLHWTPDGESIYYVSHPMSDRDPDTLFKWEVSKGDAADAVTKVMDINGIPGVRKLMMHAVPVDTSAKKFFTKALTVIDVEDASQTPVPGTGKEAEEAGIEGDIERIVALKCGGYVACVEGDVYTLSAERKVVRKYDRKFKDKMSFLTISPDEKKVAYAQSKSLRILDLESGDIVTETAEIHSDWLNCAAWTPCGEYLLTGGQDKKICLSKASGEKVWEIEKAHNEDPQTISVSSDGKFFFSGGCKRARVWPLQLDTAPEMKHEMLGHSDSIMVSGWVGKGDKYVASGDIDGHIVLWDTEKGEKAHEGKWLAEIEDGMEVLSLAVSPNGKRFAYGGRNGDVFVRRGDEASWEQFGHAKVAGNKRVLGLAFKHKAGGRILAAAAQGTPGAEWTF